MTKLLRKNVHQTLLLTLNRPKKINALDAEIWMLLRDALIEADLNNNIKSVVITGAGGNFSSGVDLESMVGDQGNKYEEPFETCIDALMNFNKPLIAAAEGMAVGGGATILLHFDFIFLDHKFKMKYPFTELGLVPELGSTYLLYNKVGFHKAFELLTSSEWILADEYYSLGLATNVSNNPLDKALKLSKKINALSQESLIETKRILKSFDKDKVLLSRKLEADGMKALFGSEANLQAVTKFFTK
tara:strand:- start:9608 stop:10342 length:735 start_codon:yes stop_codon:yes gene_type:complete